MAKRVSRGSEIVLDNFVDVLADVRAGKGVVVVDNADRENEGDVIFATDRITPETISFLMREARGLICVSIPSEVAERLRLPLQVVNNNSPFQTPFAVSVDLKGVTPTGVTAEGRAKTMRALIDPSSRAGDFITPGHVFPLIANSAGVMGRQGHTEGAFDLARLAGLSPSGILCEVLNADGTMARGPQLQAFAQKHTLRVTSIQAIRDYRALHEIAVRQLSERAVDTDYGLFHATVFADDAGKKEHVAMVRGDLSQMPASYAPLVRLHSECLTGDVFGSRRCDCGRQLDGAMKLITEEGAGVILYLRQEGRGIGLENKVRAYALQDQGLDTVEANVHLGFDPDERDFAVGAHMLLAMGVKAIRLITNNPAKGAALARYGIAVVERIPIVVEADPYSEAYLRTKREKLGHIL